MTRTSKLWTTHRARGGWGRGLRLLVVVGLVLPVLAVAPSAFASPPGNTQPPTIQGSAYVGAVLSLTSVGQWTGDPAPTFSYAWQSGSDAAGWKTLPGAVGTSYTVQTSDLGRTLRIDVTGTNSATYAVQASQPTAVITNAPDGPGNNPPAAPNDVLGTPGMSRVASADGLLVTEDARVTDPLASDSDHRVWMAAMPTDATGNIIGVPPLQASSGSSGDLPHYYPRLTATGRFADQNTDGVLSLTSGYPDGLQRIMLTSDSATALTDKLTNDSDPMTAGRTYFFTAFRTTNQWLRWVPAAAAGQNISAASSNDLPSTALGVAANLWTPVAVPGQDGWLEVVNRASGDCLTAGAGTQVAAQVCPPGTVTDGQLWRTVAHVRGAPEGSLITKAGGRALQRNPDGSLEVAAPITPLPNDQRWIYNQSPGYVPGTTTREAGGDVATWSVPAEPFAMAMATGDLDRVSLDGAKFTYHDEAVVGWLAADGTPTIRVIDYNAVPGGLTMTAPSTALPRAGAGATPGSMGLAVGDFDGDGLNEIAYTWQDAAGVLRLTLLKYRATDYDTQTSGRSLQVIGDPNGIPLFGLDEVGAPKVPLWTGMPEVKAADYDGDGRDDLAIAYAATPVGKPLTGYLGVVSLTATLGLRGQATTTVNGSPLYDGGASNDGAYGTDVATRGMQLAPGLFRLNPASGYKIDRRQLAAAWTEQPGPNSLATYVSVFSINPSPSCSLTACTFAFSEITPRSGGTTKLQQTDNAPLSSQQYPLPLSLAAGGFKGRDGTTPKTWGLALSVNDDGEHAGPSNSDPRLFMLDVAGNAIKTLSQQDLYTDQQAEPASYSLTAFDATGASLELGAPAVVTITNLSKASMIAAQPPSHSDWSPTLGNFINVSRIGSFSVALGSSSTTSYQHTTTHDSNWNGGFSFSNDAKASFNFDEGVAAESGSVEGKTDLATKWFGTNNDLESYSSASSTSLTQRGDDDDLIRADITNSTVYRYPILGGTAKNPDGTPVTGHACSPTCYGIYEVVVPGRVQNLAGGGRSMDFYQPSWENGNALSYPVTNSNDPPPADLGGYSYYGADGQLHTNSSVLLDQNFGVGGTSGTVNLNITSQTGNGNTTSHGNNWQLSESIAVSLGGRIGPKLENTSAQDTATFSGTGGQEFVTNDNGNTTDSSGSSLQVDVPAIESNDGYQINAKYYYDTAGAARVAFSDNLTADAEGRNWWEDEYGQQPDPALNLPNSTFLTFDQFNVLHIPKFTTQADAQAIRGFKVTHPTDITAPNVSPGAIYADNPVVGDKVVFQVPVNNYSLVPATNVPVDFYAVPMTGDNVPKIAGPAVHLGTTQTIPRIDPQGTQVVSQAWTASALPGVQGQQLWRIFVVLDRNGSISEIHPWQGGTSKNGPPYLGGAPCPKSALNPQPGPGEVDMKSKNVWVMIDPMTGKDSTLACGQNNQGYGTVTVSVTSPNPQTQGLRNSTVLGMVAAKAAVPAGVQFAGAGLADSNPNHNLLGANEIPTVPVGQFVTGVGYASTTTDSIEHQPVIVYDGPPAADNVIAVTTLNGVDNVTGGHASFTWQAKNPGLHTIHLRLLGTPTAGADDDQEFKIMVTAPNTSTTSPSTPSPTVTSVKPGGQAPQSAGQLVNTGAGPVFAILALAVALLSTGIGIVVSTRRRRTSRLR